MKENCVIFKGKKDGLIIMLDNEVPFDELKGTFAQKVREATNFFGDAKVSLSFKGRELAEAEEEELLDIVTANTQLKISHVGVIETKSDVQERIMEISENATIQNCLFHRSSLRSGQDIRYSGSVVIVGDVNPGGEVIAEGNVVVLGAIKGLVHAGCSGNTDCYVFALNLSPIQLRIADIICHIPPELKEKNKKNPQASFAYVDEGQVYIAQL